MGEAFACPQCGEEVRLPDRAPTRRVRCDECLTLVELPYFRRGIRRPSRFRDAGWSGLVIAFSLAIIVIVGTYLIVRSKIRADRARAVSELISLAASDGREGQWQRALDRLDAAMALVAADRARAAELRVLHRQAERQLELAAASDLESARTLQRVRPAESVDLAVRAFETARRVPDPRADRLAAEARELVSGLVESRGVVFEWSQPDPLFGEEARDQVRDDVESLARESLGRRGYVTSPQGTPLALLWDRLAPYRFRTEVTESFGDGYLQANAPNRTSRILARMELSRGGPGGSPGAPGLWQARPLGRTRSPSPRLGTFASSRIGLGTAREAKIERVLYEDARIDLIERVGSLVANIAPWPGG